jgi:DNA-directed RNA polymerase specialized sigma24 family protein
MPAHDPITLWISQLKAGHHRAAQQLWDRYFAQMVGLARARLRGFPRRAVDEEDIALNAFDSFCRGAEAGRFPQLQDRENLWPLLVVITARKAVDARQHEARQKRGAGAVQGESAWFDIGHGSDALAGIDAVIGAEPTPAFAAEVAEQLQRLLGACHSTELRAVVLWKMEGYTNQEIAKKMGCVERTVERRLHLIRGLLEQELQP